MVSWGYGRGDRERVGLRVGEEDGTEEKEGAGDECHGSWIIGKFAGPLGDIILTVWETCLTQIDAISSFGG